MTLYDFELFVSDNNPVSAVAIANLEQLCSELGSDACTVRIVDVLTNPAKAEEARVFAVPTLIKKSPGPQARVLGDLADRDKILALIRPRRS